MTPAELLRKLLSPGILEDLAEETGTTPRELRSLVQRLLERVDSAPETPDDGEARECVLYADGASRNNPGPASAGAVLYDTEGNEIATDREFLGRSVTNNEAEYRALLLGLQLVPPNCQTLTVRLDSELVVKQLQGEYAVRNENLRQFYDRIKDRLEPIPSVRVESIPREENEVADRLANRALDERGF